MTSRPDPSDLASDLADGLLSGEEAARAVATPEVAARVEEIYQLRAALREVPPPPELPKARTLAAAVEAGMDAQRQESRPPGGSPWRPWLAAAAILAVVVLGVGLFALRDSGNGDVTASGEMADESPADSADSGEGGDTAADSDEEAPQSPREGAGDGESLATEDTAELTAIDLGAVADEDELATAVVGADRSSQTDGPDAAAEPQRPSERTETDDSEETGAEGTVSCPQLTQNGDPERGRSTLFATATLDGERVWVHLYPDDAGEGSARLIATDSACVDVVDRIVPA